MNIITGNKFKKYCDFVFDENGFIKNNINNPIPIYFVKTDFLNQFIHTLKPNNKFKLITHNSDLHLSEKYKYFLDDSNLICWYGQNVDFIHPKLKSIPIGIANEIWSHGCEKSLIDTIKSNNDKKNLLYSNFDINTNRFERTKCLNAMSKNGIIMSKKTPFKEYLTELSESLFSLSPNGNGVDCHKFWESLYLKTIPIVTESINVSFYKDLPIYLINRWDDLNINKLDENLYNEIIKKWDPSKLEIDYYYKIISNNE